MWNNCTLENRKTSSQRFSHGNLELSDTYYFNPDGFVIETQECHNPPCCLRILTQCWVMVLFFQYAFFCCNFATSQMTNFLNNPLIISGGVLLIFNK